MHWKQKGLKLGSLPLHQKMFAARIFRATTVSKLMIGNYILIIRIRLDTYQPNLLLHDQQSRLGSSQTKQGSKYLMFAPNIFVFTHN